MGLRTRRGNLVVWSSAAVPARRSRGRRTRPSRAARIRWWVRTGALLAVLGVLRVGHRARTRWEQASLAVGTVLTVVGFVLPAAYVAFLAGMLVLVIALLKGIASKGRSAGQAADCWQWRN